MDNKLLDALNNLSKCLEKFRNQINPKNNKAKSPTATTLQSGDLNKKINMIDKGVKQLISDNKKILKNQQTIMELSKKKSIEKDPFSSATDKNKSSLIKDGLKTILLIAVGVLAIGQHSK
jgi:hypothetical protein